MENLKKEDGYTTLLDLYRFIYSLNSLQIRQLSNQQECV